MTGGQPIAQSTEAALRSSIARFGVIVPVVVDQHGTTIDGHNRTRIAQELGVLFETKTYHVADDDEAREVARTLNEDRRHMPKAERLRVVQALRADGHSTRAIAGAVGVSEKQVRNDLDATADMSAVEPPAPIVGLNGKRYQARKGVVEDRAPLNPEPNPVIASRDEEWMRLRRLGETQRDAARQVGLKDHDVVRIISQYGDPLPKIGGMNAYDMLESQTRQIDVAATLLGQIVDAIDPAHPKVRDFLLALQKMRAASDNAERALRRASIRVMS